jgi:agmatine deiminase
MSAAARGDGWRLPADFEPHECTWLAWPHDDIYAGYQLKYEKTWLELVAALARHELVRICVQDARRAEHVRHQLEFFGIGTGNVELHEIPTNDLWICDHGPLVVVNEAGERAIVNWKFNGWGERFPYDLDARVPRIVAEKFGLPRLDAETTLESGHEVNGKGSLIVTRTSVLNQNRNPGISQEQVEEEFRKLLGVTNTIWLTGMDGNDPELGPEETDCHVDALCRFVNEDTVLYGWPEEYEAGDPAFRRVFQTYLNELHDACNEAGKPLTLLPVPAPRYPIYSTSVVGATRHISQRGRGVLAACGPNMWYCGYLDWHVANGVVLVPIVGDQNDARALAVIAEHFPGREVVGIDCRVIQEGGGGIHCVTKGQAAAPA